MNSYYGMVDFSSWESVLNTFYSLNLFSVILRLFIAAAAGSLIGHMRVKRGSAAGMRTHLLVCIGAAITSLTNVFVISVLGFQSDAVRLSAQVITGIGFLGAGTILIRNQSIITGLTTAAGIWAVGCIGVAAGFGFYTGVIIATFFCIFAIAFLSRLEKKQKEIVLVYIEVSDLKCLQQVLEAMSADSVNIITRDIVPAKTGIVGNIGLQCQINHTDGFEQLRRKIDSMDSVAFVVLDRPMHYRSDHPAGS